MTFEIPNVTDPFKSATLSDEEHNATLLNLGAIFADVRSTDSMLALLQG